MKRPLIIAIDPGKAGGLVVKASGEDVSRAFFYALHNIPQRLSDLVKTLRVYTDLDPNLVPVVVMEDVGYHVQGNNAQNSATFARHCGQLEGICVVLGLPLIYVDPKLWMNWLLENKVPADKIARKTAIYDRVRVKTDCTRTGDPLTRRTSDALGICLYACAHPTLFNQLLKQKDETP